MTTTPRAAVTHHPERTDHTDRAARTTIDVDPAPAIDPGEVHVWHIPLDGLPRAAQDHLATALGPEELRRRATYPSSTARARYTVAHGTVRLLLGHFLGIPARAVRIRCGPLGKPELAPAAVPPALPAPDIRYSLSHTQGHAMVAMTTGRAIGVDLEHARPGFPLEAFTRRYFPGPEHDLVLDEGSAAADREQTFLRLWTRKEALVKAAGARMAVGVRQPVCSPAGLTTAPARIHARHPRLHGTWTVQNLPPPHPLATGSAAAALALSGSHPYRVVTHTVSHPTTHEG
ncbi:4'-phosphopantetheinyl transferase superfamily protein (plasmid) [Streptomyces sp. NBC_00868]|uniref:4'-phosphopantetheinyl transferase family protein n=1 Tax=Streptomyces sp. NBC_00868 TaxID=2903683 RepID=UPI002F91314A|nr:4'-phosphopantetheinyl transferase superfamily protein [Streptomyces sp. NBC_00868]